MADQIQKITTDFTPLGVEDLQKAYELVEKLNKTPVNTDTSKAQKQFTDLNKAIEETNRVHLEKLKAEFREIIKIGTQVGGTMAKISPDKLKALIKIVEEATDEFQVFAATAKLVEENMDKLDLKPEEFAELGKQTTIAKIAAAAYDETITDLGGKSRRLSTELRDMRDQLAKMEQAGLGGTVAFRKLQIEAAKLENQIETNTNAVRALASDTANLEAGVTAIRAVAGAFALYQGVLALAGEENEELQRTLVKLNAAMAILQGLEELQRIVKSDNILILKLQSFWNGVYATSLEGATIATGEATAATTLFGVSIRTLLASTGIGLLIVGVTTLIAVFSQLASEAEEAAEAQDLLNESTKKYKNEIADAIIKEKEYQKILSAGSNQAERDLEILIKKGASLDVIKDKQLEISNRDIQDTKRRIALLKDLNDASLRDGILKEEDELRGKIADRDKLLADIAQKELLAANTINQLRISNIKTEYERQVASIEARLREEIRLNKLSNEFTRDQKIAFERETNERIRQERLKLDYEANKQLAIAANAITQDQYDKQVTQIKQTYEEDYNAYQGAANNRYIYDLIIEQKRDDAIAKLNEEAELKIQAIKDSLITDEYKKKIRLIDAQAKADIKAFVGSTEAKAAYEEERTAKANQDKLELDKEAQLKIANFRASIEQDAFTKRIEQGRLQYEADLKAFEGNEEAKAEYRLLLLRDLEQKEEKLRKESELKITEIQVSRLTNVFRRSAEQRRLQAEADIRAYVATGAAFEQVDKYRKERLAKLNEDNLGDSPISKLFGIDKEQEALINESFNKAVGLLTQLADAKIEQDDREIASQENKIARFKELAETGSAELLQLEEDRLIRMQARRAEDVEKQRALAAVQISINSALAVSEGILATISAFNPLTGGSLLTGILTATALAATVASSIVAISQAFSSVPAYAKGTEYLRGSKKSDGGQIIEAHEGERIVDAPTNKKLGNVKNKDLPGLISIAQLAKEVGINNFAALGALANHMPDVQFKSDPGKDYSEKFDALIDGQNKLVKRISGIEMQVNITEKGIHHANKKIEDRETRIKKRANL